MPAAKNRRSVDEDPLAKAIAPPPDETPAQREERLVAEKEAKQRSDAIDEELRRSSLDKKNQKPVKVLLLGQSESGKSTTLKNFQLINSPKAFRAERALWRAVVQLNVTRSIRLILDAMNQSQQDPTSDALARSASPSLSEPQHLPLTPELLKLKMRLSPLTSVEEALWRKLSPDGSVKFDGTNTLPSGIPFTSERSVNSASHWKNAFGRLVSGDHRDSGESQSGIDFDNPGDPAVILHNCRDDMIQLWNDPSIKSLLHSQKLRLEDMPGFFLDSLERVTELNYVPSDDDILKARLKTLGVSEHRFTLKGGNMVSRDWRVFDVGGARTLRAAWAPFFDDMDAIIFLAPLSCFDQVLAEDPAVNRLEDSILLWKSIVSNPLLKETNLILFLNKCDIFEAKLAAGVPFARWVLSYGDRPNTFDNASQYMRKKFAALFKSLSPQPGRPFYCHFTCVTDMKATNHILGNVKDMLVRQNLVESSMV